MKMRGGFVSNSSSSSFILFLEKKPATSEDMKLLLFGDKEYFYHPYYEPEPKVYSVMTEKYPTLQVAETVYNDLKNQEPMTLEQLCDELSCGWVYHDLDDGSKRPAFDSFRKGDSLDTDWETYQKVLEEYHMKLAKQLINKSKGKEIYFVEYSDDTTYGCALEQGSLFEKIEAVTVSKH